MITDRVTAKKQQPSREPLVIRPGDEGAVCEFFSDEGLLHRASDTAIADFFKAYETGEHQA